MSKPIINGIDVSECSYYNKDNEPYCCEIWDNECEAQNCYFKQLKRLQEENERLQMLSCANCGEKYLSPDGAELYEKNVQLQEENEKLKEESSQKSNLIWYIFHCSKIETIQRLLYEYYECINDDRYNKKRVKKFWDDVFHLQPRKKYKSKYEQALEEIKKIANCNSINTCWTILNTCSECADKQECEMQSPFVKLKEILSKINEVLK